MSWAPTGTNNVPLGTRNRISEQHRSKSPQNQLQHYQQQQHSNGSQAAFNMQSAVERARAIANSVLASNQTVPSQPLQASIQAPGHPSEGGGGGEERKRRRKNRWGSKDAATQSVAPGVATALTGSMSKEQIENYAAVLRIDEITRKLKSGDVVPPDGQRSPSPPPVYNGEGKRTNTREQRYRRKLEEERMRLVEEQLKRDPEYRPPSDFKRRSRYSEKVFIPVEDNPGLNFIGLLIGPRGNTLKKIEGDSGTKISIRGKGSIKEGKRRDDAQIPGADEELHCHIVADSEEKVKKGVRLVRDIINKACVTPEGHNDLKRNQLRELAALNGTLRDDEGQACTNCGALGHRRWECPEQKNVTVSLVCRVCGGKGHIARDCNQRHDPVALQKAHERDQQLNSEYLSLMAELGESVPAGTRPAASMNGGSRAQSPGADNNGSTPSEHGRIHPQFRRRDHSEQSSPRPLQDQAPPGIPPWLRNSNGTRQGSPAKENDNRYADSRQQYPRSPPPTRPLAPPTTPPWLRRRPHNSSQQHHPLHRGHGYDSYSGPGYHSAGTHQPYQPPPPPPLPPSMPPNNSGSYYSNRHLNSNVQDDQYTGQLSVPPPPPPPPPFVPPPPPPASPPPPPPPGE